MKTTYGLVGYPLGHSLSPVMHNTAFQELGVDAVYELFPMPQEALKEFFASLKDKDSHIFGLNVTVPHKENVMPFLDSLDSFADKVGAVNTVVITDKRKLVGYNTDGPGFLTHLTECGFDPEGKTIAIMGAGGASRAIISVLCLVDRRPKMVRVFDTDSKRANALVSDLSARMDVSRVRIVSTMQALDIRSADLLINATPVGMKPEDPCLVDARELSAHQMVYDLVYNPAQTRLLALAQSRGARAVNGLRMLYFQGVLAFQHWAGMQLEQGVKDRMWQELESACYRKS